MKKGPAILLVFLLLISVFMLGIKYGQKLQSAASITSPLPTSPVPSPKATNDTSFTFAEYTHKGCGIQFLKPNPFKVTKESSLSAVLSYKNQNISFECPKKPVRKLQKTEKTTATSSVLLQNKTLQGYREGNNIRFIIEHAYRKTPIIISIDNNLLPLIQSSLKFTP